MEATISTNFRGRPLARRAAAWLIWLGLCAPVLSLVTAHPAFAFGVWSDSEAMGIALLTGACACLVGLAALSFDTPAALRNLLHPAVLACMLAGAWSVFASLAAEFPFLSILGAPQTMQGALWYFALGAFIAAVMVLRHDKALTGSLTAVIALAALVAAIFNLSRFEWFQELSVRYHSLPQVSLLRFNEYQAYFALSLLPIAAIYRSRQMRTVPVAIFAIAVGSLLVSRNRAAMAAIGGTAIAFALIQLTPLQRSLFARAPRIRLSPQAGIAAAIVLAACVPYVVIRLIDLRGIAGSLWSRQLLFKAVEPSLSESPGSFLVGHGWGHFSEQLIRHLPAAGISQFDSEWQGVSRDLFHSHNSAFEAFFSAGLPGLILAIAIPVMIAATAQQRFRAIAIAFAVSWATIDAFWFMMPATTVPLALAAGLLLESSQAVRMKRGRSCVGFICLGLAFATAAASVATFAHARAMTRVQNCLQPSGFDPVCERVTVPSDPRGCEEGLGSLLGNAVPTLLQAEAPPPEQRRFLRSVFAEAERRFADGASLSLGLSLASGYAALAFGDANSLRVYDERTLPERWRDNLLRILDRAPQRIDILPTYLNWLLLNQRMSDIRSILARSAKIDPTHPVVLWFSGIVLAGDANDVARQQGLGLMRQALAAGIERYMPVEESIKSALRQGSAAQ